GGANMAEGVYAEGAPEQARADRRMPMAVFQALDFIGQMAQRVKDQAPREFGGGGIGAAAPTAPTGGDHDTVLGAGGDIEVIGVAPRLADASELGQALDDLTGQGTRCCVSNNASHPAACAITRAGSV